ncbi:hypothetical protein EX30DRAFT_343732 [Ascodesmis nigricans]|uniref:Uncharacterized protein n=1 Tax=Ascodesmis nigricans TaxID=341454 RepID=A0A4V3SHW6_9PEZI|nr:hypothetical protein EX30DRAFT_343732 [Ascodesmis nigricans]
MTTITTTPHSAHTPYPFYTHTFWDDEVRLELRVWTPEGHHGGGGAAGVDDCPRTVVVVTAAAAGGAGVYLLYITLKLEIEMEGTIAYR